MSTLAPVHPTKQTTENSERYVIPNLRNACRILKLLAESPVPMKAAEIARTLSIPVTTTLRIMTTLHVEGLVRKQGSQFDLGPVLIRLGTAALSNTEIRELAVPVLEKLTARTDETSHLAIPCDGRSLIVAVQDSPHPLRAASRPGFLGNLHCTSTGKTFLAFVFRERIAGICANKPEKRTANTKTTVAQLTADAEETVRRGYGLDDEEFNPGVRCVAAPVFDAGGAVVAAIGITAASVRFTKQRIPEMAGAVKAAAAQLSTLLGHAGRAA